MNGWMTWQAPCNEAVYRVSCLKEEEGGSGRAIILLTGEREIVKQSMKMGEERERERDTRQEYMRHGNDDL